MRQLGHTSFGLRAPVAGPRVAASGTSRTLAASPTVSDRAVGTSTAIAGRRRQRTAASRRTPRRHRSGTSIAAYSSAVSAEHCERMRSDDRPAGCPSTGVQVDDEGRSCRDHRSPGSPQRRRLGCRRRPCSRRSCDFDADDSLRVAVLTGRGRLLLRRRRPQSARRGRSSAGRPTTVPARWVRPGSRSVKPVIAAIEGPAVAGGLELALWCDLRVAARPTPSSAVYCRRFGVPLVDRGTINLPRLDRPQPGDGPAAHRSGRSTAPKPSASASSTGSRSLARPSAVAVPARPGPRRLARNDACATIGVRRSSSGTSTADAATRNEAAPWPGDDRKVASPRLRRAPLRAAGARVAAAYPRPVDGEVVSDDGVDDGRAATPRRVAPPCVAAMHARGGAGRRSASRSCWRSVRPRCRTPRAAAITSYGVCRRGDAHGQRDRSRLPARFCRRRVAESWPLERSTTRRSSIRPCPIAHRAVIVLGHDPRRRESCTARPRLARRGRRAACRTWPGSTVHAVRRRHRCCLGPSAASPLVHPARLRPRRSVASETRACSPPAACSYTAGAAALFSQQSATTPSPPTFFGSDEVLAHLRRPPPPSVDWVQRVLRMAG